MPKLFYIAKLDKVQLSHNPRKLLLSFNICPSNVIHWKISFLQNGPLKEFLVKFDRGIHSERSCDDNQFISITAHCTNVIMQWINIILDPLESLSLSTMFFCFLTSSLNISSNDIIILYWFRLCMSKCVSYLILHHNNIIFCLLYILEN